MWEITSQNKYKLELFETWDLFGPNRHIESSLKIAYPAFNLNPLWKPITICPAYKANFGWKHQS